MASNKSFKDSSVFQIGLDLDLDSRIFNLVIGRLLKRVYLSLGEKGKENMEKVFLSDNDEEKEKFVKKYIPNFKKIFKEEAKKFEGEIKVEIEKSFKT